MTTSFSSKTGDPWFKTSRQWFRLRLTTCRPGFESQAHHLRFYNVKFVLHLSFEKHENKHKRSLVRPIQKTGCQQTFGSHIEV